jgi:alkanesulfonate monooxygenase SsuD/methylene tetrahydromethanopterin reductase-like flavin-dependent oxidoreductase (luciferase family)
LRVSSCGRAIRRCATGSAASAAGDRRPSRTFINEIEGGSLYVGSPETVAMKIAATVKTLGADRFDMKYSSGTTPHEHMMKSIELYGTKVIPMVRDLLASDKAAA